MTAPQRPEAEGLLTPDKVAQLFRVDPKTVTRWAQAGKLTSIRTLGGHRRYRTAEVMALMNGQIPPAPAPEHTVTVVELDGVHTVIERNGMCVKIIAFEGDTTDPLEDVAKAAAAAYGATYVPAEVTP